MELEQGLLDRCLAGEDSAWEALLKAYTRKIYNLCYRFTGRAEEAEDVTQEVFIKVFQTLKTYQAAQGSFTTWLNRVARNHLVDHYRRARKDRVTSPLEDDLPAAEQKPSQRMEPTSQVESRERREVLQLALDKLSPDLREAVILRDLQDLDYVEIAQVLRVPQGTVKSRINRGRLELGRVLKRMEGMRGPAKAGSEP